MPLGDAFSLDLAQQDAGATHGPLAACWGGAITGSADYDRALAIDATPGVTPQVITVAGVTTLGTIFFESGALGFDRWDAGAWIVKLRVSVGNANIGLKRVYVCRVNSAGVNQASIASNVGLNVALLEGTYSVPLIGSEQAAATTDRVYVVFVLENIDAGPQDITIVPDQMILTPIVRDLTISGPLALTGARKAKPGFSIALELEGLLPTVVMSDITVAMPIGELELAAPDMTEFQIEAPPGVVYLPLGP